MTETKARALIKFTTMTVAIFATTLNAPAFAAQAQPATKGMPAPRACAVAVEALSKFLTADTVYSARTVNGDIDPDKELYDAAIVAKNRTTGQVAFSNITAAPTADGGCNASYDTVISYAQDCKTAHAADFARFTKTVAFGDSAAFYSAEGDKTVLYMIPTPSGGCTAIKQQVLYQADLPK